MNHNDVLIKWIGSKRIQGPEILKYFPKNIETYYEPFIGGGSMMYLLTQSSIKVNEIICSDINVALIGIYQIVQKDPNLLIADYSERWNQLDLNGDYYYEIRKEFNIDKDPFKFFFLLRTCRNGLVRHNKKGNFNSPFHHKRKGIIPLKLAKVIKNWHEIFNKNNIHFKVMDYSNIQTKENDFIYLDPPYQTPKNQPIYFGMLDYNNFWEWIRKQKANYVLSLNGFKDKIDCTMDVPSDLYKNHVLIENGLSKFEQLCGNSLTGKNNLKIKATDSLYIKVNHE